MNRCGLTPAQYTNELLLHCARRAELTRAYFDVGLPYKYVDEEAGEVHVGPLDAGILALLFREVGAGVEVTFRQAWYLEAIISDEFSKRLLEKAHQYAGANNVKLIVACNIEQQMGHLADFQQFRRAVAASGRSPAKTIYDLPANGRGTFSLTFSEGVMMSPRKLYFESGVGADQ